MNEKAIYELTITEKLEQLTAPDMRDAIWARIEAQLDIDLPTDDGPTDPPTPKSGPRKWINRGFFIVAVALVLIYLFNNRKQTITSNDQPTITTPNAPVPNENPVRNNSPGTNNTITPQNNAVAPTASPTVLPVDSNTTAPVTGPLPLQPDSNKVNTNAAPVFTPPVITQQKNNAPDSSKKQRGVKGITDADYKIVPKKDSSKN